jgi:hypothetical protein
MITPLFHDLQIPGAALNSSLLGETHSGSAEVQLLEG